MTFKKGQKPPKKGEKVMESNVENSVESIEKAVDTVVENEINNIETAVEYNTPKDPVIGMIGNAAVVKPKGQIKFEAKVQAVPMFKLPLEIRQYLINNGFTTDVYKKDKEWLEKHGADMKMIEKLKNFITNLN